MQTPWIIRELVFIVTVLHWLLTFCENWRTYPSYLSAWRPCYGSCSHFLSAPCVCFGLDSNLFLTLVYFTPKWGGLPSCCRYVFNSPWKGISSKVAARPIGCARHSATNDPVIQSIPHCTFTESVENLLTDEIPKALPNRAKLNPIVKTVKNCWN